MFGYSSPVLMRKRWADFGGGFQVWNDAAPIGCRCLLFCANPEGFSSNRAGQVRQWHINRYPKRMDTTLQVPLIKVELEGHI